MANRSAEEELRIYKLCDEVRRQLLANGDIPIGWMAPRLAAIAEGREFDEEAKKRDFADERRLWLHEWYRSLGLCPVIPKPNVSNREFSRRARAGQALFYRTATSNTAYETSMRVVGQRNHWTVVDAAARAQICWDPSAEGYWFWAEIASDCPRINRSWNDLTGSIRLLRLEEYVIVWHAHKAATNMSLDANTWTWLRTRYLIGTDCGALGARASGHAVDVSHWSPEVLSVSHPGYGGRLAEVLAA